LHELSIFHDVGDFVFGKPVSKYRKNGFGWDTVLCRRDKIENLTLWAARPNQAAQASFFEEKKENYKDSGFAITSNLTRYEKWDSEAMEERGKLLFRDACKIFRM